MKLKRIMRNVQKIYTTIPRRESHSETGLRPSGAALRSSHEALAWMYQSIWFYLFLVWLKFIEKLGGLPKKSNHQVIQSEEQSKCPRLSFQKNNSTVSEKSKHYILKNLLRGERHLNYRNWRRNNQNCSPSSSISWNVINQKEIKQKWKHHPRQLIVWNWPCWIERCWE